MRFYLTLLIILYSSQVLAKENLPNIQITVYTTNSYPILRQELADKLYFLDAVENLELETSRLFSKSLPVATQQAKRFMQSTQGKKFQEQLQQAYVGVVEGWKNGVMKVPAIVFTHKDNLFQPAVIYGETNIAKAIEKFKAYQP